MYLSKLKRKKSICLKRRKGGIHPHHRAGQIGRGFLFIIGANHFVFAQNRCWSIVSNKYWLPAKWTLKLDSAPTLLICSVFLVVVRPGVKYIQWLLTYSRKPYICLRWECLHRLGWPKRLLMSQLPNWQSVPPTAVQKIWRHSHRYQGSIGF